MWLSRDRNEAPSAHCSRPMGFTAIS